MKYLGNIVFIAASLLVVIICSCQKIEPTLEQSALNSSLRSNDFDLGKQVSYVYSNGKMTTISGKLENPYTVDVMLKAYNNLMQIGELKEGDIKVRPTHYYLRVLPKNWEEYDQLIKDKTIEFYDRPLDVNVIEPGDYFQDSNIAYGKPTWQYFSLPVESNYEFVGDTEKLAVLYIPEEDGLLKNKPLVVSRLVEEAMKITKNRFSSQLLERAAYTPSGTVKVFDSKLNVLIPFEGIKVRMNRWFSTYTRRTDSNGNFSLGETFNNGVNYSLVYEDDDFDVRSGAFGQAKLDGPKLTSAWNVDINDNPNRYYATVFRAARDYFRNTMNLVLTTPPKKMGLNDIKIGAYNSSSTSANGDFAVWRNWLFWPDIRIYNPERESDLVYSTTIHELAHAVHWNFPGKFNGVEDKVVESWARFAQWVITNKKYKDLGTLNSYNFEFGWQYFRTDIPSQLKSMKDGYSPVFIDCMDTENQFIPGQNFKANDKVIGFTINDIENAIKDSKTLGDCRDKLKNMNKVPAADLDLLFEFYIAL